MINRVILMGNLTADPELHQTQNGVSVLSFTIAIGRRFTTQTGERKADFIHCVAWRQTAEFISKYFNKGKMVAVDGTLQSRNYVDKNGNNRNAIEVIVENVSFCGNGKSRMDAEHVGTERDGDSKGDLFSSEDVAGIEGFEELGSDDSELPF